MVVNSVVWTFVVGGVSGRGKLIDSLQSIVVFSDHRVSSWQYSSGALALSFLRLSCRSLVFLEEGGALIFIPSEGPSKIIRATPVGQSSKVALPPTSYPHVCPGLLVYSIYCCGMAIRCTRRHVVALNEERLVLGDNWRWR